MADQDNAERADSATDADGSARVEQWVKETMGDPKARLAELEELARDQLHAHPGRTALVALGLGFLIGRAFTSSD